MLGMLGKLGMLGMLMPGISGISRVAWFTMTIPTPATRIKNTTAPIPSTTHGMPPDALRGGGAHGAP
jgi:hypothetical protein